MQVTFLEAKMALVKQFGVTTDDGDVIDKAYPRAANFKTHTHEFRGIVEYHNLLCDAASNWYGMLKGRPLRELETFGSRKKLTDREAPTDILVLDIDGLKWDIEPGFCDQSILREHAERFVKMLPQCFQHVSYVAMASSSMAYKKGLRMHLHFLLDSPKPPSALRAAITWLNLNTKYVRDNITLTPARAQLSMPIDPCVADNSRIIYIAPPIFENGKNPFSDDAERIALVTKAATALDLDTVLEAADLKAMQKEKDHLLEDILRKDGLEPIKPKLQSMHHRGKTVRVLKNPETMSFDLAEVNSDFVRYNVNGGDSNAYWVWMDNPDIVYSFKPDELPFSFRAANADAYEEHLRMFGKQINQARMLEFGGEKFTPLIVYDEQAGTHFAIRYNATDDSILRCVPIAKTNIEEWLGSFGLEKPEKMSQFEVSFDPSTSVCMDIDRKRINTYKTPEVIREAAPWESDPLQYGDADEWMAEHTPVCREVLMNMLGDDVLCFEHFINWFAYLVQKREKPETAWVVHGVEGTGKGLFIKRIAKPILGDRYVSEKFLNDIAEDKFNGFLAESLLVFVDEFNINAARNVRQTADMLKLQITQGWMNIREMHRASMMRPTYFGMIFASNDIDQMRISASDRRYNVAVRQEVPLNKRINDLQLNRNEYDAKIEQEVKALASMLQAYDISEHHVRTPLENEAKRETRLAGMTQDALFMESFKNSDLDFFEGFVTDPLNPKDMIVAQRLKNEVMRWMADCITERETKIDKEVLRAMFTYMTDFNVSQVAFGRKCKQFGLHETRFQEGEHRFRGFARSWRYRDKNVLVKILESNKFNAKQGSA